MCLAYPGTVIEVNGSSATISYPTRHWETSLPCQGKGLGKGLIHHPSLRAKRGNPDNNIHALLGDAIVKVGDKVLVQMGIVIKVLTEEENENILAAWSSLN